MIKILYLVIFKVKAQWIPMTPINVILTKMLSKSYRCMTVYEYIKTIKGKP